MSSQVCRSARFALEGAIARESLRGGLVAAQQGLWEAQGRFRGSQATNCSLFACFTQSLALMMLQQQRPSRTGPLSHLGRAWQRPQRPAAAQGTQSGGAAAPTAPPTSGTVTVLFKGAQVVTEAQPGENLLEVRCADWRATYALRVRGQEPGLAPSTGCRTACPCVAEPWPARLCVPLWWRVETCPEIVAPGGRTLRHLPAGGVPPRELRHLRSGRRQGGGCCRCCCADTPARVGVSWQLAVHTTHWSNETRPRVGRRTGQGYRTLLNPPPPPPRCAFLHPSR